MIRFILLVSILNYARSCPDEYNCRSCIVTGKTPVACMLCENSFLNQETKECQTAIPIPVTNCVSYSDKSNCSACEFGFSLDESTNSCYKCTVDDCAACSKDQKCSMCFKGLSLTKRPTHASPVKILQSRIVRSLTFQIRSLCVRSVCQGTPLNS